jgi:hypothetical protein
MLHLSLTRASEGASGARRNTYFNWPVFPRKRRRRGCAASAGASEQPSRPRMASRQHSVARPDHAS